MRLPVPITIAAVLLIVFIYMGIDGRPVTPVATDRKKPAELLHIIDGGSYSIAKYAELLNELSQRFGRPEMVFADMAAKANEICKKPSKTMDFLVCTAGAVRGVDLSRTSETPASIMALCAAMMNCLN